MNETQILEAIQQLGESQGCYARLYNRLMHTKEHHVAQYNAFIKDLVDRHFKDVVDLILYLES